MKAGEELVLQAQQTRDAVNFNRRQKGCWPQTKAFIIEYVRLLFSLLFMLATFVIAAPLAVLIASCVTFAREVYIASTLASNRKTADASLTFLAETQQQTQKDTVELLDDIFSAPDDHFLYLNLDFWIAMAGTPLRAEQNVRKTWVTLCSTFPDFKREFCLEFQDMVQENNMIDVDKLMTMRNEKPLFEQSKIDYDMVTLTYPYVPLGHRTSYSLKVIASYITTFTENQQETVFNTIQDKFNKQSKENSFFATAKKKYEKFKSEKKEGDSDSEQLLKFLKEQVKKSAVKTAGKATAGVAVVYALVKAINAATKEKERLKIMPEQETTVNIKF